MSQPDQRSLEAGVAAAREEMRQGRPGRAVAILKRLIERAPHEASLRIILGTAYFRSGDQAGAESCFRTAARLAPNDPAAHVNLGNVLKARDDLEGALTAYRRATDLDPKSAIALYNLGMALREKGEPGEAVTAYDRALALAPDLVEAWYNRANALSALGRQADAVASYDEALRRRPNYPEAIYGRGMAQILAGAFATGWDDYEARWRSRTFDTKPRWENLPRWTGEDLSTRGLLVWGEQGIGDEMRFLTVLGEVAATARQCVYEGDARLVSLIERGIPNVQARGKPIAPDDAILKAIDCQIPVGSLPRLRRRSLAAFPPARPLFTADTARLAHWRGWLASLGSKPKVGVSWRSGKPGGRKRVRYAPPDRWVPLLKAGDTDLICLQYDECGPELARLHNDHNIVIHVPPGLDRRDDFEGQAALYAALDLIIAAPTTVADLAGALAVPSWVIVHAPHLPWGVWPEATGGQPWYANLRMINAQALRGWQPTFDALAHELAGALAAGKVSRT